MHISKYIKTSSPITTLGAALLLGYLGYRAVRWVIHKCSSTAAIQQVSSKALTPPNPASPTPPSIAPKAGNRYPLLIKAVTYRVAGIKSLIPICDVHAEHQGTNAFKEAALIALLTTTNFFAYVKALYTLRLLVQAGAHVPSQDTSLKVGQWPALTLDISTELPGLIQLLIQGQIDLTAKNPNGRTALHLAAKFKFSQDSQASLNAKIAEIETMNDPNLAAAFDAVKDLIVHVDPVQALLDAGADVHARDNEGLTPLMFAIISGNEAIARKLIQAHADVNAWNTQGWTPLMFAVAMGNEALITYLIEAGAHLKAIESDGRTAYDLALLNKTISPECIKRLEPWKAHPLDPQTAYVPVSHTKLSGKRNWSNFLILSPYAIHGPNPSDELHPAGFLSRLKKRYPDKDIYVIKIKETPSPSDCTKLSQVDENTKVYVLGHGVRGSDRVSEFQDRPGQTLTAKAIADLFAQHSPKVIQKGSALHIRSLNCQGAGKMFTVPGFCETLCNELYQKNIKAVIRGSVNSIVLLNDDDARKHMSTSTRYPPVEDSSWVSYQEAYSRKEFFIDHDNRCNHYFIDYPVCARKMQKELEFFKSNIDLMKNTPDLNAILRDLKNKKTQNDKLVVNYEYRFLDHPEFLDQCIGLLNTYDVMIREIFLTVITLQLSQMAHFNQDIIPMAIQHIQHSSVVAILKAFPELQTPEKLAQFYAMNPFCIALLPEKLNNDAEFLEAVKRNGRVISCRQECHDLKVLDMAIDQKKEVLWDIVDTPFILQTLQRRPELFQEVVKILAVDYQYSTNHERLNLSQHLSQAFPEGIMQAFYTQHPAIFFAFLKTLDDDRLLPRELFFINQSSAFWTSKETQKLLQMYPVVFSLFCHCKHAKKRYFTTCLRMCQNDVRLIKYVPSSAWHRPPFQKGFLHLAEQNPSAFLSVNMSKEQAKELGAAEPDFYMQYRALFLRKIGWNNPACVQAAMRSALNAKLIEDNALIIVSQSPTSFPDLGIEARQRPDVALLAVQHDGLLLQHALMPARMDESVVNAALANNPDAWKHTV